jgi:hypothetical protein
MRKIGLVIAGVVVSLILGLSVVGCGSSTSTPNKMNDNKMGDNKMGDNKMGDNKMGDNKMGGEAKDKK